MFVEAPAVMSCYSIYFILLFYTLLYSTLLYYTIWYCSVLYCTILYNTLLYSTEIPWAPGSFWVSSAMPRPTSSRTAVSAERPPASEVSGKPEDTVLAVGSLYVYIYICIQ